VTVKITTFEVSLVAGALGLALVGALVLRASDPDQAARSGSTRASSEVAGVRGDVWDGARRDEGEGASPSPAEPAPVARQPDALAQPPPAAPSGGESSAPDETAEILALHPQVRAEVSSSLEAARVRLRNACYKGAPVALRVEVSFDPAGRMLVVSVPDDPRDPSASTCVRAALPRLSVAPPGRHVTVEVPFRLP